jgi:Flp pilus assembly protein TadD
VFVSLGTIGVRRGLYAQAEEDLKRAIELDPKSPSAHHYRGEALNQIGRVDEALGMLEQAARLDPTNPRTYYVMGIVLDKKGRSQEAGAMFRRSRELTPG